MASAKAAIEGDIAFEDTKLAKRLGGLANVKRAWLGSSDEAQNVTVGEVANVLA